jgi:mannose-6-phosphate isomerase-like protein (cupin superfamily)
VFYAGSRWRRAKNRVFWVVESGLMRVNIEGQAPFVATKGFLVQAAPRLAYSMEPVGNEPVLRFEVRPARASPIPAATINTTSRISIS